MNAPDVSIIVVTYNRAHTLRQCLDSIRMQTYPSKEILVLDDGSTDDTAQVIRACGEDIRYHPLEHQGLSRARNSSLALARGKWIAFLDSDDYYLSPDVTRDFLGRFLEDPALDVVASGWKIVNPDGLPMADVAPWEQAPVFDLESCLFWKPTFLSTKMFRREVLEKAGGFDPAFESTMDTDLFFRILLDGSRIGWLRKITSGLRQSPDAMMRDAPSEAFFLGIAIERVFASPQLPAGVREKEKEIRYFTNLWLAWDLWSRGFPLQSSDSLSAAVDYQSALPFVWLKNWWAFFQRQSQRAGIKPILAEEFLSIAAPVAAQSPLDQKILRSQFEWWLNVWSHYSDGKMSPDPSRMAGKAPSARELVDLSLNCLWTGNDVPKAERMDRLWQDTLGQTAGASAARGEAMTLFLAGLGRTLHAGNWSAAGAFLERAVSFSGSPKAVVPWISFLRDTAGSLLAGEKTDRWSIRARVVLPGPRDSEDPFVSVIMPTYNRMDFIARAIESVLQQDYPNLELIIIDDGSTDSTADIIQKYCRKNLRYVRLKHRGPAAARNAGLALARGELTSFLDSDDYFLPGKIRAQAERLKSEPRLGAVHSGWEIVDETGRHLQTMEPWRDSPVLDLQTWLRWKPVFLGSVMIRSSCLKKAGSFDSKFFQTDDVDMMLRLALTGCRMTWLRQSTVGYRQHQANITRNGDQQASDLWGVVDAFLSRSDLPGTVRSQESSIRYYTLIWIAFELWRKGYDPLAGVYIEKAISYGRYGVEETLFHCYCHLVDRAYGYRLAQEKIDQLKNIFLHLPFVADRDRDRVGGDLDWLSRVWQPYREGGKLSPESLLQYSRGRSSRRIVELLLAAVMESSLENALFIFDTIWDDLVSAGVLAKTDGWEWTDLYLTAFAQSVFRRRWITAASALGRAFQRGIHWRAIPIWGKYMRTAAVYALNGFSPRWNRIQKAKASIG